MLAVISVEFSTRELDAQIFLAHALAKRGVQCLVLYDQIAKIVCREFAKKKLSYVLIDKSASESCFNKRIGFTKQGPKSLAYVIMQESFINITEDQRTRVLWKKYTSSKACNYVDGIFTFGRRSAEFLSSDIPSLEGAIHAFGNPRIDLLQKQHRYFYQAETNTLSALYGDFVLLNDAHLNPDWASSPDAIDLGFPAQWSEDSDWVAKGPPATQRFHAYNKKFLGEVIPFLKSAAAQNEDTNFIVRPHPNNRADLWAKNLRYAPNIQVQYFLPVEPWLLSSKFLMTDGCTTGLQMLAAGKQVASLDLLKRPDEHPSAISKLAEFSVSNHLDLMPLLHHQTLPTPTLSTLDKLSPFFDMSGDAGSRIAEKIVHDAEMNGLADMEKFIDVFTTDLSRVSVPAHQPWKWQAGLFRRVKEKVHLMNEHFDESVCVKKVGWNSFALAKI